MPDYEDHYDDDLEDDDELYEDCGLTPDGLCQNAGTEWCDWSCPLNRERNAERIRKMNALAIAQEPETP